MTDTIQHDHNDDGVDRRGFLKCMAWAGTGMLWAVNGGVLSSASLSSLRRLSPDAVKGELFFAQISDSHIGFSKEANPDVTATLQLAVERVKALPQRPAFVLHTGDISQLSKPSEFDTANQVIKGIKTERVFYVPGEHDVLNLKAGGLGSLGPEQLAWLKNDVRGLSSSTPIVVFAHIPLWTVYPEWGWGTDDSEQALGLLKRFGSVGVLNGHIHQVLQKVEGNVRFHTAMSTAFPQPAPGTAPSPGPLKVEADRLRKVLGIASVEFLRGHHALAVVDSPLDNSLAGAGTGAAAAAAGSVAPRAVAAVPPDSAAPAMATTIKIDNFSFSPPSTTIATGTTITWLNADDVPHKIVSSDGKFTASPALDTNDRYAFRFTQPGRYEYFCALHPKMTGAIVVQ